MPTNSLKIKDIHTLQQKHYGDYWTRNKNCGGITSSTRMKAVNCSSTHKGIKKYVLSNLILIVFLSLPSFFFLS